MSSSKVLSILLVFAIHLHLIPSSSSKTSPVAIHPERNKLLEDALSWLTLRQNGKLLTPTQNAPFLEALRNEYRSSRLYRATVISFQYGILHKLTLGQGETCAPAYRDRDRNRFNDTITWWNLKIINQQNYLDRDSVGAYCDYRQGLMCHPTTKKCECPEGSKMGPIEENSPIQRCLLEENQPCALADLGISSTHEKSAGKLHEIIFNLEKPLSCEWGTQCRHKGSRYTKCSKPPFDSNSDIKELNYGEECVVDYIGEKGNCEVASLYNGPVCFNFWGYLKDTKRLPSSGVHRRKGFCALDMAPYVSPGIKFLQDVGITIIHTDYFVTVFVNPRTVSMPSSELIKYDEQLHEISDDYRQNRYENEEGQPCSVADTQKLKDIWNFYRSLEGDPPQGQDFVADVPTLNAKLAEYKNLIGKNDQPKICRIVFEIASGTTKLPLICKSSGDPPDTGGNDGTCVPLQGNAEILSLREHAERQWQFYQVNQFSRDDYHNPENHYEPEIIDDNPEKQCTQTHTRVLSKSTHVRNADDDDDNDIHHRGDVLEDGTCQDDRYFCFEDLDDKQEIYEDSPPACNFIPDYQAQFSCLDVLSDEKEELGDCEMELLRRRSKVAFETVAKLGHGAACNYQTEQDIPEFLSLSSWRKINGYRVLMYLKTHGICDPTKLLECSTGNTCGCREQTNVRKSADGMHTSEYCYLTSGPCNTDVTQIVSLKPEEEDAARLHYGDPLSVETGCINGNICYFIDSESDECTIENTGKTGVDVKPTTTRPPINPPPGPGPPPPLQPPGPQPPAPVRPPGPGPPSPPQPPGPGPPAPIRPPGPGPPSPPQPPGPGPPAPPPPRPIQPPIPDGRRPLEPVVPFNGSEKTFNKTFLGFVISMIIVSFSRLLQ